jgi:RNA polymerase primary sigma factor
MIKLCILKGPMRGHIFEIKGKLMKSFKALMKKLGREPTSAELSKDSGIPLQYVEQVLSLPEEPVSLDLSNGEENWKLEDLIADEKSPTPIDSLFEKELVGHIRKLLSGLPPREEKILRLRYGIGGDGEYTLEEIYGLAEEKGVGLLGCTFCGILRRRLLNETA